MTLRRRGRVGCGRRPTVGERSAYNVQAAGSTAQLTGVCYPRSARGWTRPSRPMCSRMRAMTPRSVIAAMTCSSPPYLGHRLKSMANTRCNRTIQPSGGTRWARARRWPDCSLPWGATRCPPARVHWAQTGRGTSLDPLWDGGPLSTSGQ